MNELDRPPAARSVTPPRMLILAISLALAAVALCSCISQPREESDFVGPARGNPLLGPVPASAPATIPSLPPPIPATGPVRLGLLDAVLVTLRENRDLAVQKFNPPIERTFEDTQRAAFDPTISGHVEGGLSDVPPPVNRVPDYTNTSDGQIELDEFFPTGTTVAVSGQSSYSATSPGGSPLDITRVGISVTQALLRGNDINANLATLREAEIDTRVSQYVLRGFVVDLVAQVEETYWNYALAQRQIDIFEQSLQLAKDQLAETEARIRVGALPETERPAAQAEIALRNEDLINARGELETTRLNLLKLINPSGPDLWNRDIILRDQPFVPTGKLESVELHAQVAMRIRADLNEARLEVEHGDLEVVRTRNGMLPVLNFFVTAGKSGYAESFGQTVHDLPRGSASGYDFEAGIQFSDTVGERDTRAAYRRAVLTREQAQEAVANLLQLAQLDVRSAYIEVRRAREQIDATAASRKLEQEKLRSEQQKLRVGRSTSLQVAQVQRDLLSAQIAEIQAVVQYLNALVELYRQDGSLLSRLGIAAPGKETVPGSF